LAKLPDACLYLTGSGTLSFIPKWTPSGTQLGNSLLFDDGISVGLGTTAPTHRLNVSHSGSTGIGVTSTAGFSVVDIDAQSGDAALRFQRAGVNQWNVRNRPGDDYFEIFELGGGGSRVVIQDATGNVGIGETTAPHISWMYYMLVLQVSVAAPAPVFLWWILMPKVVMRLCAFKKTA
jgi:hypothetical protein